MKSVSDEYLSLVPIRVELTL
uniref:Uncharacterized protein n=1 Tax=Anguilla anguilla TaxID=7936 RepID=A0A0E9R3J3_ANGAN